METTRKEKCDRGACVRPYTERPAATISYFFSCVVETVQTNNKISKVPRVGEIMLAYSLLCFVVCVAFALLLATGHRRLLFGIERSD